MATTQGHWRATNDVRCSRASLPSRPGVVWFADRPRANGTRPAVRPADRRFIASPGARAAARQPPKLL